ncbi:hypothetical protein [Leptospira noguchii]|uniref:hypothetical protein n=1 Tax=Leptospira noguchii TaxID=28182 RepID=UPI0007745649|nr:hypothetical protein [Leptospira noguchii]UOG62615.1 restriction endonuclease [Leptospira noguchii]
MEHTFTATINNVLEKYFGEDSNLIFAVSDLLKYINNKTRSAERGSKSRGSFANLYAIYVLLEDYKDKDYINSGDYSKYEGAIFSTLFKRQRELPFGSKLQNHALNHRLNEEFKKFFPTAGIPPIIRNVESNRYWFNESLLIVKIGKKTFNLCLPILEIIDEYIKTKKDSFEKFIEACEKLRTVSDSESKSAEDFIKSLLAPNVDARLFEIVSYSILKYYYFNQNIYWGYEANEIIKENLKLFKTGRTNANDGGIDFVMKPLGRFFQVTETLDVGKYFLDIDKIEKYPITFVVKSLEEQSNLLKKLEVSAKKKFPVDVVVHHYMQCIEEVINITELIKRFNIGLQNGFLKVILDEIILQSKVEFNYDEEDESEAEA